MKLFEKDPSVSKERLDSIAQAPAGNKTEGEVLGFSGVFGYTLGDIWLSDGVEQLVKRDPEFEAVLRDLVRRIYRDDYGDISRNDADANGETRYLCGSCRGITADYRTGYGRVLFRGMGDSSLFYLPHEAVYGTAEE